MEQKDDLPNGLELFPRKVEIGEEVLSEASWYRKNGWVRRVQKKDLANLREIGNFINEIYYSCTLTKPSPKRLVRQLSAEQVAEAERKQQAQLAAKKSQQDLLATEKKLAKHQRVLRKGRARSIQQGGRLTPGQELLQANLRGKLDQIDAERQQQVTELVKHRHRVKTLDRQASVIGAKVHSITYVHKKVFEDASLTGGDESRPRMFTISFPGECRSLLFQILASMHFQLEHNPSTPIDVHAMNQTRVGTGTKAKKIPQEWDDLFTEKAPSKWQELMQHLKTNEAYKEVGKAPAWFVKGWGAAAWYSAHRTDGCGCGVIAFTGWPGYQQSFNCKLEHLFCQCLVTVFPRSVYDVQGTTEQGETIGDYMTPETV